MAAASECYSLEEELELLEAIYIHELTIEGERERPSSISLLLHPSTGDEGEKQYVCLTLNIVLPEKYPEILPSIQIANPRGLSEAHIESIAMNLHELAESCIGSPMLYELIEYAKECLTDNNMPSCACAICLSHFQDSHSFTKTECYHYFHSSCLARCIEYTLRTACTDAGNGTNKSRGDEHTNKVVCPMCRLPITYDLEALRTAPEDHANIEEVSYKPDKEMKELQKKMSALYEHQARKGGIIDIEQERNKFLIGIKATPSTEVVPESIVVDEPSSENSLTPAETTRKSNDVVIEREMEPRPNDVRNRPNSGRRGNWVVRRGRGGRYGGRWDGRGEGSVSNRAERNDDNKEGGLGRVSARQQGNSKLVSSSEKGNIIGETRNSKHSFTQESRESQSSNERETASKAAKETVDKKYGEINGVSDNLEDGKAKVETVKSEVNELLSSERRVESNRTERLKISSGSKFSERQNRRRHPVSSRREGREGNRRNHGDDRGSNCSETKREVKEATNKRGDDKRGGTSDRESLSKEKRELSERKAQMDHGKGERGCRTPSLVKEKEFQIDKLNKSGDKLGVTSDRKSLSKEKRELTEEKTQMDHGKGGKDCRTPSLVKENEYHKMGYKGGGNGEEGTTHEKRVDSREATRRRGRRNRGKSPNENRSEEQQFTGIDQRSRSRRLPPDLNALLNNPGQGGPL